MEVLNQNSALLSNYEVLTLLRELESDHLARTKTALRIKKEEELAGNSASRSHAPTEDISENLRTIEVEAIQYLSADYQPTASQSDEGITQLTRSLSSYELTKSEKLQIVNLAPTEPVELYVVRLLAYTWFSEPDHMRAGVQIVEELEDRFGNQMDNILSAVRSSLSEPVPVASSDNEPMQAEIVYAETTEIYVEESSNWEQDTNEVVFDDTGEGAGVEGDLDMEDD
ncbi:DNA-directed RNA polymerase III subunit RPC9 [Grifola frondosa]|uniref:DNA-directed RNA polymerase III subunit RPC9 n=1 Tax=Grifola frondosa TaxID=5627 RepID=A0A1C7M2X0_GRIFR|nr:DNA-directed RNA polymerase III subunit RPC9 [Grifola frondosa]